MLLMYARVAVCGNARRHYRGSNRPARSFWNMYKRAGLKSLGLQTKSGEVTYE